MRNPALQQTHPCPTQAVLRIPIAASRSWGELAAGGGGGDSWLQPRNRTRGGEGGRERAQASEAFAAGGGRRAAWIVWAAMPRVRAAQRFGLPCRHLCRQTSSRCAPCVPRSHSVSKLRAHAETRVHVTSDVRGTFVYRQVCSHALDMLMCANLCIEGTEYTIDGVGGDVAHQARPTGASNQ